MNNNVTPANITIAALTEKYKREPVDKEAIRARQVAVIAEIGAVIIGTPGLNRVRIYGYTPGFNDGDPCKHTMGDVYLNGFTDWGDPEAERFDEDDDASDGEVKSERFNDAFKTAEKVINDMDFALEDAFDTDWSLVIVRNDDGTVGWKQTEYDCGY